MTQRDWRRLLTVGAFLQVLGVALAAYGAHRANAAAAPLRTEARRRLDEMERTVAAAEAERAAGRLSSDSVRAVATGLRSSLADMHALLDSTERATDATGPAAPLGLGVGILGAGLFVVAAIRSRNPRVPAA